MIKHSDFVAWLKTICPDLEYYEKHASPIPDKPDRLVMTTKTPGAGLTMDGLFDRPGFFIRIRGAAHDPDSTESDAQSLDHAILTAAVPVLIGDSWVTSVTRFGGLGPLPGTPDLGHRTEWAVTYIVTASTNL